MVDHRNPIKDQDSKPAMGDVVKSTLAAALGVQSNKNRERDFKHGNFKTFVIAGVIFTALFVGAVIAVVKLVLKSAGV